MARTLGGDPNIPDNDNHTPMMYVCSLSLSHTHTTCTTRTHAISNRLARRPRSHHRQPTAAVNGAGTCSNQSSRLMMHRVCPCSRPSPYHAGWRHAWAMSRSCASYLRRARTKGRKTGTGIPLCGTVSSTIGGRQPPSCAPRGRRPRSVEEPGPRRQDPLLFATRAGTGRICLRCDVCREGLYYICACDI